MGKKAENSTRNLPFAIGTYRLSLYTEKGKKAIDATGSHALTHAQAQRMIDLTGK